VFTAGDAARTAQFLADHGHTDPDAITVADFDAAADYSGSSQPEVADDRYAVLIALEVITG
jgi:hypothetical protein